MKQFVENPIHFAADCVHTSGQCTVERASFLFLDAGKELEAIGYLQRKCGHVVVVPDASDKTRALLYQTSCERMNDVVGKIFKGSLQAPAALAQAAPEMSVGEMHRRAIALSYADCKAKIDAYRF